MKIFDLPASQYFVHKTYVARKLNFDFILRLLDSHLLEIDKDHNKTLIQP